MYKDVHDFYRSCDACQRIGGLATQSLAKLAINLLEEPFMKSRFDFVELIKLARRYTWNKYVLFITDYATKWVEVRALRINIAIITSKFCMSAY